MQNQNDNPKPDTAEQPIGEGSMSTDSLDDWDVGGDGMPVKKGDSIVEEDGELKTIHADGTETRFV